MPYRNQNVFEMASKNRWLNHEKVAQEFLQEGEELSELGQWACSSFLVNRGKAEGRTVINPARRVVVWYPVTKLCSTEFFNSFTQIFVQ